MQAPFIVAETTNVLVIVSVSLSCCPAHFRFMCTLTGYPRSVRLWKRGTSLEASPTLFEGEIQDHVAEISLVQRAGLTRLTDLRKATDYFCPRKACFGKLREQIRTTDCFGLFEESLKSFANCACCAGFVTAGRFWLCIKAAQPPAASDTAICELPHYGPAAMLPLRKLVYFEDQN